MNVYHGRPKQMDGRSEREQKVYEFLDLLEIDYERADHEAAATIEACKEIDQALGVSMCKNLFLCNRRKTEYYLLLLPGEKPLRTKELSAQIPTTRLSFASGEDMETYLHVTPGSATVLALLFDPDHKVKLLVDEELLKEEYIGCHPCVNTSSLKLRREDLFGKILKAFDRDFIAVRLSGGEADGEKTKIRDEHRERFVTNVEK